MTKTFKGALGILIIIILVLAAIYCLEGFSKQEVTKEPESIVQEETAEEIDTSNWQTYTNEEYGFSFKYPEEWEVKTRDKVQKSANESYFKLWLDILSPDDIKILSAPGYTDRPVGISILVDELSANQAFTDYLLQIEKDENSLDFKETVKITDKTIGNLKTKFLNRVGISEGTYNHYLQNPNNTNYVIDIILRWEKQYQDKNIIQILSTFRFTE